MDFDQIAGVSGLNNGATENEIASLEVGLGISLPQEYREFLAFSNGALFESGISLYPLQDLAERNQTFEVDEYLPGYVLIGDDSGGTGILLSLEPADRKVYSSGLGDMNPADLHEVAPSFQTWLNKKFVMA